MAPEDDTLSERHRARVTRIRELVVELDRNHRAAVDRIHELLDECDQELRLLDDLWNRMDGSVMEDVDL